jgi:tripartite-type tricarboxylate transporter receptor subunit TctC
MATTVGKKYFDIRGKEGNMRKLRQRRGQSVLVWIMAAVGLFFIAGPASLQAQQVFPSKPITIIIPYGAGGIVDVGIRIFGERLSRELKVPIIIENKPGGGAGFIGTTAFLNSTNNNPDGYTLLASTGAGIIGTGLLTKDKPWDPRKAFLPVGYIADAPVAMSVAKSAPFKTFEEFLKYAKANPGKLVGGMSSLGGETDIMFGAMLKQAKIESKKVPYPNTGNLVTAILGGHIDWMTLSTPGTMQYHKSGDVRIVLLTRRSAELPGIPSGTDVGLPDVSINQWIGLFAHPKTPKPAYDKLVAAVATTAKDPEVVKKLSDASFNVAFQGPQDFAKLIDSQCDIFARVGN